MLTKSQVSEIKSHLDKAQNPIFFFDNDQDGLCSFLLLRRFCDKGRGVAIKSFPTMTKDYFRKVEEFGADYIFILDKPEVSQEFFDVAEKSGLPVVWIDHHVIEDKIIPEFVNYYSTEEPTTFACWQVTQSKNDLWLAVIGCIADCYLPDFYSEFKKEFPELCVEAKNAFDVLYKSEIGRVAQMFGAGLKDTTTNVVAMMKFLLKVKSANEVLVESNENKQMHKRFDFIDKRQKKFIEKAGEVGREGKGKLLFFEYGGDMSISSDLANELCYLYPDKIIVVAYLTGVKVNLSIRGKGSKKVILNVIEGFENATAGGHDDACGGLIQKKDLEEFRRRIEQLVSD